MLQTNTVQVALLRTMVEPLVQVLPASRRDLKFFIIDDPEPNAFALPGGYVVVHTGLIDMADRPEEVLAEAEEFHRGLTRMGISLKAVVANRVHDEWLAVPPSPPFDDTRQEPYPPRELCH